MRYILGLFFVCFSLITSCQPKPQEDRPNKTKKARLNLVSDPRTLDPRKSRELNERILMNMFFEGLTREGKGGKCELALADRVDISEDNLCYTFHLKEAKWSNGDPILSNDFVYAWKSALDPNFISENAYQLFCIKNAEFIKKGEKSSEELGVKIVDKRTFEVYLENPIPYFLDLLSFSIFFPIHETMDRNGWDLSKQTLISSGPFCLKQWKHHDFIDAYKNPLYWDAQTVQLSGIYLVMVNEDTEVRMFEKGELDWVGSPLSTLPFDLLEKLKKQNILKSHPMLATSFFRINVEKFPFNNSNIRKAFALAINRKSIVEHVVQGGNVSAMRFVPESMKIQKDPYFPEYDEELARSFLQKGLNELNISKKDLPKIVFLYAALQKNHSISQAIQQDWKRVLDISVDLEANERGAFFGRLGKQDYQISLGSWMADFNDPVNFLGIFKHKKASTNNTQWENREYIDLLNASDRASKEERIELLRRSESILMEEMPVIPIYHHAMLYLQKEYLRDVFVSSLGNIDFKWAYLDTPK